MVSQIIAFDGNEYCVVKSIEILFIYQDTGISTCALAVVIFFSFRHFFLVQRSILSMSVYYARTLTIVLSPANIENA